jgi:hypothetical protein
MVHVTSDNSAEVSKLLSHRFCNVFQKEMRHLFHGFKKAVQLLTSHNSFGVFVVCVSWTAVIHQHVIDRSNSYVLREQ